MIPRLRVVEGGASMKSTEEFLLTQPGVLDASCWKSDGQIFANVVLQEGCGWSERALKVACALELGLEFTPSEIQLRGARLRVA